MTDAFYMLMLMHHLGRDWDKAATIRGKKPGRGLVRAEFRLTDAQVEDVRQKLKTLPKHEPVFAVEVKDESGRVIAEVETLLHVREGADGRDELRSGGGTAARGPSAEPGIGSSRRRTSKP